VGTTLSWPIFTNYIPEFAGRTEYGRHLLDMKMGIKGISLEFVEWVYLALVQ
jgi:hypothetical protein